MSEDAYSPSRQNTHYMSQTIITRSCFTVNFRGMCFQILRIPPFFDILNARKVSYMRSINAMQLFSRLNCTNVATLLRHVLDFVYTLHWFGSHNSEGLFSSQTFSKRLQETKGLLTKIAALLKTTGTSNTYC